jgi:hypothetical protein
VANPVSRTAAARKATKETNLPAPAATVIARDLFPAELACIASVWEATQETGSPVPLDALAPFVEAGAVESLGQAGILRAADEGGVEFTQAGLALFVDASSSAPCCAPTLSRSRRKRRRPRSGPIRSLSTARGRASPPTTGSGSQRPRTQKRGAGTCTPAGRGAPASRSTSRKTPLTGRTAAQQQRRNRKRCRLRRPRTRRRPRPCRQRPARLRPRMLKRAHPARHPPHRAGLRGPLRAPPTRSRKCGQLRPSPMPTLQRHGGRRIRESLRPPRCPRFPPRRGIPRKPPCLLRSRPLRCLQTTRQPRPRRRQP